MALSVRIFRGSELIVWQTLTVVMVDIVSGFAEVVWRALLWCMKWFFIGV